jgi:hypothetical protein
MAAVNYNPDWRNPENMRANLLVTFGCMAGTMQAHGRIRIPGGIEGEDLLAAVGIAIVDEWESRDDWDISFDEFIWDALLEHFNLRKEWNL